MTEIAPDAGIFESDITIRYTDADIPVPLSLPLRGVNSPKQDLMISLLL
jgi:hypothetical protein